jgi:hypothetical protein
MFLLIIKYVQGFIEGWQSHPENQIERRTFHPNQKKLEEIYPFQKPDLS